jgi:hypothetical protein
MIKRKIKLLPFHPLADKYGGPLLEGKDFADLVGDIRKNGLRQDIDLYHGKIIDGRNRARVCVETGDKPRYHERRFKDDAAAIAFIFSKNLFRRHLTAEQKSELVEKLFAAMPEKSVREIANIAKVGLGTAARALARVPSGTRPATRLDSKGRAQPTSKPPKVESARAGLGDDKPVLEAAVVVSQPSPSTSRPEPQEKSPNWKEEMRETTALIDFANFTIASIKSGHLKVSADVTVPESQDRYRKWRDLKARVELLVRVQ